MQKKKKKGAKRKTGKDGPSLQDTEIQTETSNPSTAAWKDHPLSSLVSLFHSGLGKRDQNKCPQMPRPEMKAKHNHDIISL